MKIDAERAFDLMYLLLQEKPWLLKSSIMKDEDAQFEQEAVAFLLTLDAAKDWGSCSDPARRVVSTLLTDFMLKLKGPFSNRYWESSGDLEPWLQAVQIICDEICGNPHHSLKTH